jgi:hypothetical protein
MYSSLALLAALSLAPADNQAFGVSNERLTMSGEFGPPRPNDKFLPGDTFFLAFDMENLKTDKTGKVQYSMGMEVTDSAGKAIFTAPPGNLEQFYPFGGNKVPARAFFAIPTNQPAGKHTCKVTITDRMTSITKTIEKTFEILPPGFGIVNVITSYDDRAEYPAPLMAVPGQVIWVHYFVVGFARDLAKADKQPNVVTELRILDQNDSPVIAQPLASMYDKGVEEKDTRLLFSFPLPVNRPGQYKIEIKVEDKVGGKSQKLNLPITVNPAAK